MACSWDLRAESFVKGLDDVSSAQPHPITNNPLIQAWFCHTPALPFCQSSIHNLTCKTVLSSHPQTGPIPPGLGPIWTNYFHKERGWYVYSICKHVSCFCTWHAPLHNIWKYHSSSKIHLIIEVCRYTHQSRYPYPVWHTCAQYHCKYIQLLINHKEASKTDLSRIDSKFADTSDLFCDSLDPVLLEAIDFRFESDSEHTRWAFPWLT